jgi:hypothetical protein
VKIGETIKNLFRRQSRPPAERPYAPTEAERQREHEAVLRAELEAQKLSAVNDIHPLF